MLICCQAVSISFPIEQLRLTYWLAYIDGMSPLRIRLPELREARSWSQAELARRSGVSQPTISAIESGKAAGVDFETLERLAVALGKTPGHLITDKPRETGTE